MKILNSKKKQTSHKKSHKKKVKPIRKNGVIHFKDYREFLPNLSPRQIFNLGSFGGTYWRPIHSGVTRKKHINIHHKYPKSWWKGLEENKLSHTKYDKSKNRYKVKVGTSLKFWENKKWINKNNPYGWMHWYCDFYNGKRGNDDRRQIDRWKKLAGEKGRFRLWLITLIKKKHTVYDDMTISPKIRQTLQHWGYKLTEKDFIS
jgi:hypothetical protein